MKSGAEAGVDVLWVGECCTRRLVGNASIGSGRAVDLDVSFGTNNGLVAGGQVVAELLLEKCQLDVGAFALVVEGPLCHSTNLLFVLAEKEDNQE